MPLSSNISVSTFATPLFRQFFEYEMERAARGTKRYDFAVVGQKARRVKRAVASCRNFLFRVYDSRLDYSLTHCLNQFPLVTSELDCLRKACDAQNQSAREMEAARLFVLSLVAGKNPCLFIAETLKKKRIFRDQRAIEMQIRRFCQKRTREHLFHIVEEHFYSFYEGFLKKRGKTRLIFSEGRRQRMIEARFIRGHLTILTQREAERASKFASRIFAPRITAAASP